MLFKFKTAAILAALLCFATGAAAQDASPLSAAQLRMIDDVRLGSLGHDIDFAAQGAQLLGLNTTKIRQIGANDDGDEVHWHFVDRFGTDPTGMLLHTLDKTTNVVVVYRVDSQFHFMSGYISDGGQFRTVSDADGAAGVHAELLWWNRNVSVEMGKIRKRVAAHESTDSIAKDYGVSGPTVQNWLDTIK